MSIRQEPHLWGGLQAAAGLQPGLPEAGLKPRAGSSPPHKSTTRVVVAALLIALSGCGRDMRTQPKYNPLQPSALFDDGRSARPIPEGTVARGQLNENAAFYEGIVGGKPVESFPLPVNRDLLARGQQRFNAYCSPCHDMIGNGLGMIVRRGYRRPPSLHIDRLRQSPVGHFFDVITNGFGAMPAYSQQIPPGDRWAIVSYIRVLQFSQRAPAGSLPPEVRSQIPEGGAQ